jgi:hypothetical protein
MRKVLLAEMGEKRTITIRVSEGVGHWLIHFPHRDVVAKDWLTVIRLMRTFEKNQRQVI